MAIETEAQQESTRRNTKRTGELSEAAFLLKAESLGFHVSRPWGDSERYDFILDTGSLLWRVQLKCTEVIRARGYDIQPIHSIYGRGKVIYTADQIDFLVAHIIPKDTWYVLPVDVIASSTSLRFYPGIECKCARWESYREAWHLLRAPVSSLEAAPFLASFGSGDCRPECQGGTRDWRRCLLHAVREALRRNPKPET
jgi:PD-(D/E)XK endonuclease